MNGVLNPADTKYDKRLQMDIHKDDKFPQSVYFCGGSQSENPGDNKIYVMKWMDMHKTIKDDDPITDNSEDDEEDMI